MDIAMLEAPAILRLRNDGVSKVDRDLIDDAWKASFGAHAPNSGFFVGVAIRSKKGIFVSTNLETVAFDAVHAEASALATARAVEGKDFELKAIAVVARDIDNVQRPCSPCGSCRQFMMEFSRDAQVMFFEGHDLKFTRCSVAALLPHSFNLIR
jgi:cytidine deaminase